jgi:hypothetical protein
MEYWSNRCSSCADWAPCFMHEILC